MSKNNSDATEQNGDKAPADTAQRLTPAQVGIFVIQGFAIFVAFTTLLGRLYFRGYSNTLRVPESEFQADVLTYAVVSPDVAISGVGVAFLSIVAVIFLHLKISEQYRWTMLIGGLILLAVGTFRFLMDFINDGIPESGIGLFGVWWLVCSACWTLGAASTLSAVTSWVTEIPLRDDRSRSDRRANRRSYRNLIKLAQRLLLVGILYATGLVPVILIILVTIVQATAVGNMEANIQLRDAPLVEITLKSPSIFDSSTGSDRAWDADQVNNSFKLVHVGSKFIYLRRPELACVCPEDTGLNPGDPYQYMIPVTEVVGITQIVAPE